MNVMRIHLAFLVRGVILAAAYVGAVCHAETLDVFVSIPPQKTVVERIGGDRVRANVLVDKGKDAHSFEPSPRQAAELAKARVYFTIGLSLEDAVVPKLRGHDLDLVIVDMAKGIERRAAACPECAHGHAHHHHHHDHEARDPHVWLAPDALIVMAQNTAETLTRIDPEGAEAYRKRLAALVKELAALKRESAKRLAPFAGRTFYVFHPAYGYFADAFDLRQESVESHGRQLTPQRLRALVLQARRDRVKTLFAQPQFDRRQADAVARAFGAEVVVVDPLAENPLETIDLMARRLSKAFGEPAR